MARCGDSGGCTCVINAGANTNVEGSGTSTDPYIVSLLSTSSLTVSDSATIDLTVSGAGTPTDPHILSAALSADLGDMDDVSATAATTGQVLAWTGSQWAPAPPATAAPGAIHVTGGVQDGDGSVGAPLKVNFDTNDFTTSGAGLALNTATKKKQLQQKRNGFVIAGAGDTTTDSAGFMQTGYVAATTDASGNVTISWPTAFSTVVAAFAQTVNMVNVGSPVTLDVSNVTTTGFRATFSQGGVALAATAVTFSWNAIGKA